MAGRKTHEQQIRTFERKGDYPDGRREEEAASDIPARSTAGSPSHPDERQSEFPVSRRGMNQESTHNKHNDGGQQGHKPQRHTDAEEAD
ncbi:hypothetical protein [Aestuariivirga sp.]|uniref:hypothetical protein n=1 Tax=Aestuariivirga sp. TaxID=2650926 RepID=UPI00391A16C0